MRDSTAFEIQEMDLEGVLLITPRVFSDTRGYSVSTYCSSDFSAMGIGVEFTDDFASFSLKGVLRGLHFQRAPYAQSKIVRCTKGEIFDVVADCNHSSHTFGKHVTFHLKGEDQKMLYIPEGFAHGFCVLSDTALVEYKLSLPYHRDSVGGVRFDDPLLGIDWPVSRPILSEQDKSWRPLSL